MNLRALFSPRSIGVIGASADRRKLGNVIFRNCTSFGYRGVVFPVNLTATSVEGQQAYRSVKDLPTRPDLAIIATPASTVPAVLDEVGEAHIPAAVVISAGFRELGKNGAILEERVISIAKKTGVALLGPNCLGFVIPSIRLNASFAQGMPADGGVGIVSQSGAMAVAIADWAEKSGLGFHSLISLGNKAMISELDVLKLVAEDTRLKVLLMYLEDVRDGRAFLAYVAKIAKRLPIVILKAGRTPASAAAVASHTGALISSGRVTVAALESAGCLVVDTIEELFDMARAFATPRRPKGPRIAVVTNAGGPGILATDSVGRSSLQMAHLTEKTEKSLRKILPPAAAIHNPIDVIGDATPERYEDALRLAANDPSTDAVLAILTHQLVTDTLGVARRILKVNHAISKPLYAAFVGGEGVRKGIELLRDGGIPAYEFPEAAVHSLAQVTAWTVRSPRALSILPKPHKKLTIPHGSLLGDDALRILEKYGMDIPPGLTVRSKETAVTAAEKLGFPVIMKIVSARAVHKTDVGGVVMDVHSSRAAADTAADFMRRFGKLFVSKNDGILIQPHIQEAVEVFLGGVNVPDFGPMVLVGLGGIFVESLQQVIYHPAPLTRSDALALLKKSPLWNIIKGTRGKSFALSRLVISLVSLSSFIAHHPEVSSVDCNPVMLTSKDAWVVDARIVANQ
ncbi:MAG: hypothetical protein A2898_03030 [Candidatus Kerfeldbacteria bacterium RIFCSPLOWO2_01_FULL_48_11]|uniref:ATP-grasp domain-containing protein n=1 Tax=Candidatus Kerfeldbacteria bacterium RIFCSPLOWO2_01_FULL_48_11 TaxID=1798543 RepID=A0A1G2B7S9_9BACT|nr:MAG: putative acetyl-CoA synthetase (ADP-forming) protein [Parcubacteria group bacterium GW2011_GWA2_48_9]OGY84277.1 MAG: hypothetical protein A2898_03030 [Candidatus Kerfeldbacteria bacterium RIFCSPLOWO2_01_FULL_48_11]